ncbi:hypothetical protein [Sphingomonas colocasiae]|uniref:Uncharacterized protein n=1 Tax=Sphingomonas colocasiae TaxID=1848973 RepID=A0ABS7PXL5_9SPHN|nr:hypothetical protein [Sphingomonas colocasiae]MBY8826105.1 hypothetical protein [Sphingomonas colocasiae]
MTESLAEALPREINRVRAVQDAYKQFRTMPGVIVEPAITLMEASIVEGIAALASGDVVRMLRVHEALKGFEL